MLRHAITEVRLHPGRFVATVLAVAISVAFLAGSSVFVATEGNADALASNLGIARADLTVELETEADPEPAIAGTPGVVAVSPVVGTTLPLRGTGEAVLVQLHLVPEPSLRWAELSAGRWPATADEIALSAAAAPALGVGLDGTVTTTADIVLHVVGLTAEPSTALVRTGYAAASRLEADGIATTSSGLWAVRAQPDADLSALVATLTERLAAAGIEADVQVADAKRALAQVQSARGVEVYKYLLWGFAAVALVVGMITVANTFTITLAQRRRQIGLLRAVGASGAQVRRRFLAEAVVLGVAGSALGVLAGVGLAALAAWFTGSLFWGVVLPWAELTGALGLGVFATAASAWLPILRGTRVLPLEALQPVLASEQQKRASIVRGLVCGLLLVAGAALAVLALGQRKQAYPTALAAGGLIASGVLFAAPLFVPGLLRLSGLLVRRFGTVARLAASNAERNPRRASATATALMLAVGLIVTLQVGAASVRETMLGEIKRVHPVDISVTWYDADGRLAPIPEAKRPQLAMAPGVTQSVLLDGIEADAEAATASQHFVVLGYDAGISLVAGVNTGVADDELLVGAVEAKQLGAKVELQTAAGSRTLRVVASPLVELNTALASPATLRALGRPAPDAVLWLAVPERRAAVSALAQVNELAQGAMISGSVVISAGLEQTLGLLLAITTALLGVAVLIALIGVSNTLGLSVLERTRESALLRALGLQASSLRAMLTIEALQVTLVGVLVGLVSGAFFGWLGASAVARSTQVDVARFTVDAPQTAALLLLAVLAAAVASVLPGRRAAQAAPTETLADI